MPYFPQIPAELWPLIAIGLFLVGLVLGGLFAALRASRKIATTNSELGRLEATLEAERKAQADREALLRDDRDQLKNSFNAMASDALRMNNEQFLRLANEQQQKFNERAGSELDERRKAVESLIKPITETLTKTEREIREIEKERKESFGAIREQLQLMSSAQQSLTAETRNLVTALRRPEVRGQWGEMTLRRLVELAGMVERCDFYEQQSYDDDSGKKRPDMVVRMPNGRELVVDVKTPLDAYLTAVEAPTDALRAEALADHARKVRARMQELASKGYWKLLESSPEFVVLFLPGEQFLGAALDLDPMLVEDALRNNVVIATPTNLLALLKTIAYGWQQEALSQNAEQIRTIGSQLHERLAVFATHLAKLGKTLDSSVDTYNKAIGSLERNVLTSARKLTELGTPSKKEMPEVSAIESQPRQPASVPTDSDKKRIG